MISDVPVCSFLSGGLDSSIITAVASKLMEANGNMLNTFSFDFSGNGQFFHANKFSPPVTDRMIDCCHYCTFGIAIWNAMKKYSLICCQRQYTPKIYRENDLYRRLSYVFLLPCKKAKQGRPYRTSVPMKYLAAILCFYREELLNADGFPWSHDIVARTCLLREDVIAELRLDDYARQRYEDALKTVPLLEGEDKEKKRRREISYLNIRWFMQTLLDRMDRASMSYGLEARVPFADYRIVEYLYNVPWEMKFQNGVEKALLRDSCTDLLTPEILNRKKSPYPKTYDPAYEEILSQRLRKILEDKSMPIHRFVDQKKAEQFLPYHPPKTTEVHGLGN